MHRPFPTSHIGPRAVQRAADAFNRAHAYGDAVLVTCEDGVERRGTLDGRAIVFGDESRVRVGVAGKYHMHLINNVRPAQEVAA